MKDFGSITIYNVMFKFISKVLVYRLCPTIDSLIGHFHSSFIPNRSTTDNTFVAQEIVHRHKKKGRTDYLFFKIDFEKACNRVNLISSEPLFYMQNLWFPELFAIK